MASEKTFNAAEKVKRITAIYDRLQLKSLTQKEIDKYGKKALRQIQTLPSSTARTQLENVVMKLLYRQV